MKYLIIFTAIFVPLNAICVAIDHVLRDRDRPHVYLKLESWWKSVDSTSVPDFIRVVAAQILEIRKKLYPKGLCSLRGILTTVLLSSIWTCMAIIVAKTLEPGSEPLEFFIRVYTSGHWKLFVLILTINLIFDTLSLVVTFRLMGLVARSNLAAADALAVFVGDASFSFAMAIFCGASVDVVDRGFYLQANLINGFRAMVYVVTGDIALLFTGFLAVSTLLLTLIYTTSMCILVVAKPIVSVGHSGLRYVLASALDSDPRVPDQAGKFRPFTLLGALLTAIGSIPAAIIVIQRALSGE